MADTTTAQRAALAKYSFMPDVGAADEARGDDDRRALITYKNRRYDIGDVFKALSDVGDAMKLYNSNPISTEPFRKIADVGNQVKSWWEQHGRHMPQGLQHEFHPLIHGLRMSLKAAEQAAHHRMKVGHSMMHRPFIILPLGLSILSGATTSNITFTNPYLGTTGGNINYPFAQAQASLGTAPWAITAVRTGFGQAGNLKGITIPVFTIGGHTYVASAFGGVTYSNPAVDLAGYANGWSAQAFAEDKRFQDGTHFMPWNLVSPDNPYGSIMTETGSLIMQVSNNQASTYKDTWSVYVRATLCGSPWADAALVAQSFHPLHRAHAHALGILHSMHGKVNNIWSGPMHHAGQQFHVPVQGVGDPLDGPMPEPNYDAFSSYNG